MDFSTITGLFDLSKLAAVNFGNDVLAILLVLGLAIVYTAWRGRGAMIALVLSLYVALALYANFPLDVKDLGNALQTFLLNAGILFGMAVVIHIFISQVIAVDDWDYGLYRFIAPSLLTLTTTGLIFAISFVLLGVKDVYAFSPVISMLFTPNLFFWWLLAPIIAIVLSSRP